MRRCASPAEAATIACARGAARPSRSSSTSARGREATTGVGAVSRRSSGPPSSSASSTMRSAPSSPPRTPPGRRATAPGPAASPARSRGPRGHVRVVQTRTSSAWTAVGSTTTRRGSSSQRCRWGWAQPRNPSHHPSLVPSARRGRGGARRLLEEASQRHPGGSPRLEHAQRCHRERAETPARSAGWWARRSSRSRRDRRRARCGRTPPGCRRRPPDREPRTRRPPRRPPHDGSRRRATSPRARRARASRLADRRARPPRCSRCGQGKGRHRAGATTTLVLPGRQRRRASRHCRRSRRAAARARGSSRPLPRECRGSQPRRQQGEAGH